MKIEGYFKELLRPFIDTTVSIPLLGLTRPISFWIDTACDKTIISSQDCLRFGITKKTIQNLNLRSEYRQSASGAFFKVPMFGDIKIMFRMSDGTPHIHDLDEVGIVVHDKSPRNPLSEAFSPPEPSLPGLDLLMRYKLEINWSKESVILSR